LLLWYQVPWSGWRLILLNIFSTRAVVTDLLLSGTSAVPPT